MKRSLLAALCSASLAVALLPAFTPTALAGPAEGALDPTFSGDGKVVTPTTDNAGAMGVARQTDGKLVVGGFVSNPSTGHVIFLRYTRSGALDTTFSGDGIATPAVGGLAYAAIRDVAVQPDGKIVGVGNVDDGTNTQRFLVVRLNPNGSLDTTFNGKGWRTTAIGSGPGAHAYGVALQSDGKIVAVGESISNPGSRIALARYLPDGRLDTTFSGDGIANVLVGIDAWGYDVALQPDGKLVISGGTFPTAYTDPVQMFALRLKSNGAADTTFNGTGSHLSSFTGSDSEAYGIVVQPDGKIVIGGQAQVSSSAYDATLIRFRANGSMDAGFGTGGVATADFGSSDWIARLALQPDGRIVGAGSVFDGSHVHTAVMRFASNGALDGNFSGGEATYPVASAQDTAQALLIQPDGKIVVVGTADNGSGGQVMAARVIGDATAPYGAHLIGVPRYSTALSRTLAWAASDDNTGVTSYDVRYRAAAYNRSTYGSYQSFRKATRLPYGTFKGSPGRTYCFSVRARDAAGNVGVYGAESCIEFPVDDRTATASSGWSNLTGSHYYRGTVRSSTTQGSTLKLSVRYRHLALIVTKCSGCGTVKVLLGTHTLATVKLGASHTRNQVTVPIASSSTVRSGTVTIKQVSGGHRTIVDGLAVSLA